MKRYAVIAILISTLTLNTLAADCFSHEEYQPAYWVETICYPEGYCDGYWVVDTDVVHADFTWQPYTDGSALYRQRYYNQYGQVVACDRTCSCPNPNNCLAKNAFNGGAMACP